MNERLRDMPVVNLEFADTLSVLAHELRSPLGVLQGYLRLIQRKREADDPENSMLTAMLTATGRVADLGRQASDLSVLLRGTSEDTVVGADELIDAVTAHAPSGMAVGRGDGALAKIRLRVTDVGALADSLVALGRLVMRETQRTTAAVEFRAIPTAASLDVHIVATADGMAPPRNAEGVTGPVPFDRGGMGLSLCLASCVLSHHHAVATATNDLSRIEVRLPGEAG